MLRHIVCYRLKPDKKYLVEEAKLRLLSLKCIPGVKNIEVGIDEKKSERSFDIALTVDFESKADYKIYDKHEKHQPVRMFMHSIFETSVSVDYQRD
ncbi:MAG: Dabb family protein [Christensenellales bacterium]|jgi:hypothetical protein